MIDLRSDTVTRPSAGMRDAMASAPLGDDVFRDDPSVLALEEYAARLLGKEAALYVPTGTMANQIALRIHCRHGDELIAHRRCHIFNYETGAAAALAGVQVRTIDSEDGSMSPASITEQLRLTEDTHVANTALVAFENTHNACGGRVLDQTLLEASVAAAKSRGVPAHLDGARLANAAAASGVELSRLTASFDTVSLCLSKGLGAPVGSILAGDSMRIKTALKYRKMYGGGMRQAGMIAAAGLYALKHHCDRLVDDHRRARELAEFLATRPGVKVDQPDTNLVYFTLADDHQLSDEQFQTSLLEQGVSLHGGGRRFRAALHLDVSDDDLLQAIKAFGAVL